MLTPKYLCHYHHQWLSNKPRAAKSHMLNNLEQAHIAFEEQNPQAAIAFAGCAYETAEIVMTQESPASQSSLQCFTASAILLSSMQQQRNPLLAQAQQRLTRELAINTQHPELVKNCIIALHSAHVWSEKEQPQWMH